MHIVRPWRARLIAAAIVAVVATGCGAAAANATTSQSAFALNGQQVRLDSALAPTAPTGSTYVLPGLEAVNGTSVSAEAYAVTVSSPDGAATQISPAGAVEDPEFSFTPAVAGDYRVTYSAVDAVGKVDAETFAVTVGDDAQVKQARAVAATKAVAPGEQAVSFGAIGDIHNQWNDLDKAFDLWEAEDMDAAIFVGDLTNNATAPEYAGLAAVLDRRVDRDGDGADDIKVMAALGNHDVGGSMTGYDLFTQATGGQRPNADYVVNGYHFITVSPGAGEIDEATGRPTLPNSGNYAYARTWLQSRLALDAAENPDLPIFVSVHHPLRCTHYVSNEWYGSGLATGCGDTFESVFDAFPQAVVWGGHIHTPNNISTSIWQDGGFTTVNAPPLAYFEMERGVIGLGTTNDTTPDDAGDNAQSSVVEVKGSIVTIKNFDLQSGLWIDQTWSWDAAKANREPAQNFPFTNARADATTGPVWPEDAAITISDITASSVRADFPQAVPAQNKVQDITFKYRYQVVNKATGATVREFQQWSGYYVTPLPETRGHAVWGLTPNTAYELVVTPVNTWEKEGEPIHTTFTTAG